MYCSVDYYSLIIYQMATAQNRKYLRTPYNQFFVKLVNRKKFTLI